MNILVAVYCALLFYVLSPGVFLRLPQNGSKIMVTAVHAAIFGIILYFTQRIVGRMSISLEGMEEGYKFVKAVCKNPNKWDDKENICRNKDGIPL
jgi:hypothetical protein